MELKKLETFKQLLTDRKLVNEKQVPYMIWWVKHYLQLRMPDEHSFSQILSEEKREDWQIRQALDAVKLYRRKIGDDDNTETSLSDPISEVKRMLKIRHYARSTVKTYTHWCLRYIAYCRDTDTDPSIDESYIAFISQLALKRKVSASTQNQAFNAILFLFRNVWNREPENIDSVREQ